MSQISPRAHEPPTLVKPWGWEQILESNQHYMLKKLYMQNGHRCSLQYHKKKLETIFVLSGVLILQVGQQDPKFIRMEEGHTLTILAGIIHRMSAPEGNCYYLESSTPDPEGLDTIRISDDYNRS